MTSIGLIANPVSARDIRRIIANASNLQIADRVNIVLRVLTAAHSLGVERVLMMPDNGGIRAGSSKVRPRVIHQYRHRVAFPDDRRAVVLKHGYETALVDQVEQWKRDVLTFHDRPRLIHRSPRGLRVLRGSTPASPTTSAPRDRARRG